MKIYNGRYIQIGQLLRRAYGKKYIKGSAENSNKDLNVTINKKKLLEQFSDISLKKYATDHWKDDYC
jgi:hypothetical protein